MVIPFEIFNGFPFSLVRPYTRYIYSERRAAFKLLCDLHTCALCGAASATIRRSRRPSRRRRRLGGGARSPNVAHPPLPLTAWPTGPATGDRQPPSTAKCKRGRRVPMPMPSANANANCPGPSSSRDAGPVARRFLRSASRPNSSVFAFYRRCRPPAVAVLISISSLILVGAKAALRPSTRV